MARGNNIIVSSKPKGHFVDVIVSGTPKPGTFMQLKATTADVQGRFTYEARSTTSGAKGEVAILMPDKLQGAVGVGASLGANLGNTPGDAYVSGRVGQVYFPVAGEELNAIVLSVAGTADDVAIGDFFGIESSAGKLKANSGYTSAPFKALEVITDPTADYLLHVLYLGNNA